MAIRNEYIIFILFLIGCLLPLFLKLWDDTAACKRACKPYDFVELSAKGCICDWGEYDPY